MDHLSILKNFLDGENRLKAFPSKRKLQLCAVRYLAEKFEPGRIYTEGEVNGILNLPRPGDPAPGALSEPLPGPEAGRQRLLAGERVPCQQWNNQPLS